MLEKIKCPDCAEEVILSECEFRCECGYLISEDSAVQEFEAGTLVAFDEAKKEDCDDDEDEDEDELEDDEEESKDSKKKDDKSKIKEESYSFDYALDIKLLALGKSKDYNLSEEDVSIFLTQNDLFEDAIDISALTTKINKNISELKLVSKDLSKALTEAGDFDAETIDEVTTVFEAAVELKTNLFRKSIEEDYKDRIEAKELALEEESHEIIEAAVKEWIAENEIAIDESIKQEKASKFLDGVKSLFEECYVGVEPQDIAEELVETIKALEADSKKLKLKLLEAECKINDNAIEAIVSEITDGLAATEKEKFNSIIEEIEFKDVDSYKEKLDSIKEKFFVKSLPVTEEKSIENTDNSLNENTEDNAINDKISKALGILAKR